MTVSRARSDEATAAIRDWIIDGSLPPGTPLVETQLASRLGVSRVPVREALQRLSQQGLVLLRPGQSAEVVRRSARDVIELLEVREAIAGLAGALAAERAQDADLEVLQEIVYMARRGVESEDWQAAGAANSRFHAEVARLSGNRQLEALIENSKFQLAWLNRWIAQQRGSQAWVRLGEVLEALRSRDAERASEVYRRHVRAARDLFVEGYLAGEIGT